jgi:hypothetical protein
MALTGFDTPRNRKGLALLLLGGYVALVAYDTFSPGVSLDAIRDLYFGIAVLLLVGGASLVGGVSEVKQPSIAGLFLVASVAFAYTGLAGLSVLPPFEVAETIGDLAFLSGGVLLFYDSAIA